MARPDGETLERDDLSVQTLTPESPLGSVLCGKRVDDEIDLELPGCRLAAVIEWVV